MYVGWLLISVTYFVITDGASVVVWGSDKSDDNFPIEKLQHVKRIISGTNSFVAFTNSGVVSWGTDATDVSTVEEQLMKEDIVKISNVNNGFCALQESGRVVSWGNPVTGIPVVSSGVNNIYNNKIAYAFLKSDGTVVNWSVRSLNITTVSSLLHHVDDIFSSYYSFAALTSNGSIISWGESVNVEADSSTVSDRLQNIIHVEGNICAFAAITREGDVVTWGGARCGGDSSTVQRVLKNVTSIVKSRTAFAATTVFGRVVTWGSYHCGGSLPRNLLRNPLQIVSAGCSFVAITKNHSVVSWGTPIDINNVKTLLKNVVSLYTTVVSIAAVTSNNQIISWNTLSGDVSQPDLLNYNKILSIVSTKVSFAALVESDQINDQQPKKELIIIGIVVCVLVGIVLCYVGIRRKRSKQTIADTESLRSAQPMREIIAPVEETIFNTLLCDEPDITHLNGYPESGEQQLSCDDLHNEYPKHRLSEFHQTGITQNRIEYSAIHIPTGKTVAVRETNKSLNSEFMNDLDILSGLHHNDLIKLHGWFRRGSVIYFVTPLYECLDTFIKQSPPSDRALFSLKMVSIARALSHIHSLGISHMNIYIGSIFIRNGSFILGGIDMVAAAGSTVSKKTRVEICPPEEIQNSELIASMSHDIWNFGCVVYEIITGMEPSSDIGIADDEKSQLIPSGVLPSRPTDMSELGLLVWTNIIEKCWRDAIHRITAQSVVSCLCEIEIRRQPDSTQTQTTGDIQRDDNYIVMYDPGYD